MRKTIAENLYGLLQLQKRSTIWYGDIELIEECAIISGVLKSHPKKTIATVLNSLDKSPLFEKGYIKADFNGTTRRYRCYTIKYIN